MSQSEKIIELAQNTEYKFKEKGSLFHAFAFRSHSIVEAVQHLSELKTKYYDATHHCYAYKINESEEKYSDDGEPNGTAGIRILNSISHFNLTNLIVIVVRYFGGTKLGVGPLGKAYSGASIKALEQSKLITLTKYQQIKIEFDFNHTSSIHYAVNKFEAQKITQEFSSKPIISCFVEPFNTDGLAKEIINLTNGVAIINLSNNFVYI